MMLMYVRDVVLFRSFPLREGGLTCRACRINLSSVVNMASQIKRNATVTLTLTCVLQEENVSET
jgi:hypothetical protein